MKRHWDAPAVKKRAEGRWKEILIALGFDRDVLDGRQHPCPKCEGEDRFSMIDEDDGAVFCRRCFDKKNGDGFAALIWLNDWDFPEAQRRVKQYLDKHPSRSSSEKAGRRKKPRKTYANRKDAIRDAVRQVPDGKRTAIHKYSKNFAVVRIDEPGVDSKTCKPKKQFRPVYKTADGWIIGTPEGLLPLYEADNLPEHLGELVVVVEGERAADAGRKVGLYTTTNAHGSNAVSRADWTPLAWRNVALFPDNDPAGEKWLEAVLGELAKLDPVPEVRVVRPDGLPPKGGMVEYVKDGGDEESFLALVEEAEPVDLSPSLDSPADACAWQPFPIEVLPRRLRSFVRKVAAAVDCDASYVALPVLSVLSAAIGNSRCIRLKNGWDEPSVFWGILVGVSGTMKSPALDFALKPVHCLQAAAAATHKQEMEQYRREVADYEAARKAKKDTGDLPKEPICTRFLVSDTTVEALAARLQHAPRGLLVFSDELSGWFARFDRYAAGGGGGDVAHYLAMHGARLLLVDRKQDGTKPLHISRAAVSVVGGIQPQVLARTLGVEYVENGLAARFLFTEPPRRRKRWTEAEVGERDRSQYAEVVKRLYGLELPLDDQGMPCPKPLVLSRAARALWIEFYNQHAEEQVQLGGDLAATWSKLEGYAARFALVVRLASWAEGTSKRAPAKIDAESMAAGITLARWFGNEAKRIFAGFNATDAEREQRELVEWIAARGGQVTIRELAHGPRQYRKGDAAEEALRELAKAGFGEMSCETTDKGGRPSEIFRLHPAGAGTETPENPGKGAVSEPPGPRKPKSGRKPSK